MNVVQLVTVDSNITQYKMEGSGPVNNLEMYYLLMIVIKFIELL